MATIDVQAQGIAKASALMKLQALKKGKAQTRRYLHSPGRLNAALDDYLVEIMNMESMFITLIDATISFLNRSTDEFTEKDEAAAKAIAGVGSGAEALRASLMDPFMQFAPMTAFIPQSKLKGVPQTHGPSTQQVAAGSSQPGTFENDAIVGANGFSTQQVAAGSIGETGLKDNATANIEDMTVAAAAMASSSSGISSPVSTGAFAGSVGFPSPQYTESKPDTNDNLSDAEIKIHEKRHREQAQEITSGTTFGTVHKNINMTDDGTTYTYYRVSEPAKPVQLEPQTELADDGRIVSWKHSYTDTDGTQMEITETSTTRDNGHILFGEDDSTIYHTTHTYTDSSGQKHVVVDYEVMREDGSYQAYREVGIPLFTVTSKGDLIE